MSEAGASLRRWPRGRCLLCRGRPMDHAALKQLAQTQAGLITPNQLASAAAASVLQDDGIIVPSLPGVFRIGGLPETPAQRNHAAFLWRSGSVISHRSAGHLFGWDRVEPDGVDISFVGQTRKTPPGVRMHTV